MADSSAIAVILGIAVLALTLALVLRITRKRTKPPFPALRRAEPVELDYLLKLPASPLTRVQFYDALHSQALTTAVESYCRDGLSSVLSGDGVNVAVQTVLLTSNELKLVYKFSSEATSLYQSGQAIIPLHAATGRHLPWMMDKQGIIIEQAKEASMLGARLASVWALVVSAAHIISGMDVVKRLDHVDRKVSELLAGRAIDQDSKLMRTYTQAVSILNEPLTSDSVRQLVELRYGLFELRQTWRSEISDLVKRAVLPDRSRWHHTSWYRRSNREEKALTSINDVADKLRNLRVALLTGTCLAQGTGTSQDFIVNELPNEHAFWPPVQNGMQQFVTKFRRDKTKGQVATLLAAVEGYTAVLKGVMANQIQQPSLEMHNS